MSGALHLFTGSDDFTIKEAANAFVTKLCGGNPAENPELEIIRGDSDTENAQEILDSLINTVTTPPFLTPRKIVWLKHFDKFDAAMSEPSDKKKKSRLDIVTDLFKEGIMDGITVVIDGPGLDKRRVAAKALAKVCAQEGCSMTWLDKIDLKSKASESQLIAKAKEYAEAEGKSLTADAAVFLAKTTAGDLIRLKNEVVKLTAYAGTKKSIGLADCRDVCASTQDSLSYEFSSALAERDCARALELIPGIVRTLEQGSSGGNAELAIVAGVANEFKRMLSIRCEGIKAGVPPYADYNYFNSLAAAEKEKQTGSVFAAQHPYRSFNMWKNCMRFQEAEYAEIFDAIYQANRTIVTGGDARFTLENLAVKTAGGR